MQRLACNVFLSDLTLEFDAVGVVLGHGFHPWKARRPRSIPNPRPVHRQGRTPYSNLRDRNGHLCCNGQDCRPVEATVLPNGNYYLPASDEIIPADMAAPSPDDRF